MSSGVSFKEVVVPGQPNKWVAIRNGQVIATSMSEQGVRSMVLVMEQKAKQKAQGPKQ